MKKTQIYKLVRDGKYEDAASLLLDEVSPKYGELKVSSPKDAFPILKKYGYKRKEYFVSLNLNGGHYLIDERVVSIGIVNRTVVHPREVFYHAILQNAVAVLLCHNHPSGKLDPSPEDKEITKRLVDASEILGIAVLDHLIVSRTGYYSFVENGLMEPKDIG